MSRQRSRSVPKRGSSRARISQSSSVPAALPSPVPEEESSSPKPPGAAKQVSVVAVSKSQGRRSQSAGALAEDKHADQDEALDGRIRVAVRIRPLVKREIDGKESECVYVRGNELTIAPSKEAYDKHVQQGSASSPSSSLPGSVPSVSTGESKAYTFTFDAVLSQEATQEQVYQQTAAALARQVIRGYNACVFAYGQTGSGKTFTMSGASLDNVEQRGVIFRVAHQLQEAVQAKESSDYEVEMTATFLEIYNEQIADLLALPGNPEKPAIHEHPKRGVYVANLTSRSVENIQTLQDIIESGSKRRTVGETKMNEFSSRSHAVLSITITQRKKEDADGMSDMASTIHLIDLAGSERQQSTGATGQRQKEAIGINQSLTTLGMVISQLVQRSKESSKKETKGGKNGRTHIPYRNSVLTRLLTDSLGGNAMTQIIANISPAQGSFSESVSTLRFADRAKQIKNKPRQNIDPKVKLIKELQAELAHLKGLLGKCRACGVNMNKPLCTIQCDTCGQFSNVELGRFLHGKAGEPEEASQPTKSSASCCVLQ